MSEKLRVKIKGKELQYYVYVVILVLFAAAFCLDTPQSIWEGMKRIVFTRDSLITDYFCLAGYGASFFNAGLVLTYAVVLVKLMKLPFTGITMAVLFIDVCYAFWGKNPVTMCPILFGTYLYSKVQKSPWSRYIYNGLFGVCLGPIVTEIYYITPFSAPISLLVAFGAGTLIGFLIPPLSAHTATFHLGYNLFNVGFSAGILAFGVHCILRAFGVEVLGKSTWTEGMHPGITTGVYLFLILTFLYGLWLNEWKLYELKKIVRHPGRAVADFVIMDGPGITLMNMSAVALIGETYILLIGGDFSGPVQGAVFMAFGFAAFGAHIRNYPPVLLGVFLTAWLTRYSPSDNGLQIAALFAVGLSPIAGQFGPLAGVAAGALHVAIVMCTSAMYGGLNLYNNGFAAGWVAILLLPMIESFMQHYKTRKKKEES